MLEQNTSALNAAASTLNPLSSALGLGNELNTVIGLDNHALSPTALPIVSVDKNWEARSLAPENTHFPDELSLFQNSPDWDNAG